MTSKEFAEWLKTAFDDDKAKALIFGDEELPSTMTEAQREFMQEVLNCARRELGL